MRIKIMILNIIKTPDKCSAITYCIKTVGNSELMKGYVVITEWRDKNELLFKLPDNLIGKWIEVEVKYIDLPNNREYHLIGDYLIKRYVL